MTIANERKVFWGGYVIKEEDRMILTAPQNSQDMNYHLYDLNKDIEYLIDIDDMPLNDYCLDDIKEFSFRQYKM